MRRGRKLTVGSNPTLSAKGHAFLRLSKQTALRSHYCPTLGAALGRLIFSQDRHRQIRCRPRNTLQRPPDVIRDLAYKLGALPHDETADFLIAYQHAYDLVRERDRREAYKQSIERVSPRDSD
jgi:hypothetical protein